MVYRRLLARRLAAEELLRYMDSVTVLSQCGRATVVQRQALTEAIKAYDVATALVRSI